MNKMLRIKKKRQVKRSHGSKIEAFTNSMRISEKNARED